MALSHCWGSAQTFVTTKSTLAARKSGINFGDLPKTFQDAIVVTRMLGVQYLWIDSLCILQGDVEDWEREGSRMADIYQNSYLTIIAARSPGDNHGFLQKRDVTFHPVTLRYYGKDIATLYLQRRPEGWSEYGSFTEQEDHPLQFRAWALQESFLPKRKLVFYHSKIAFECQYIRHYESGENDMTRSIAKVEMLLPARMPLDISYASIDPILGNAKPYRMRSRLDGWYGMLHDYTRRKLIYQSDIFPALSGLASLVAAATSARYLAGIWDADLVTGLLWWSPYVTHADDISSQRRSLAPSWSWAAVGSMAVFAISEDYGQEVRGAKTFMNEHRASIAAGGRDLAAVIVHDIDIRAAGADPFGRVRGGVLDISSIIIPLTGSRNPTKYDRLQGWYDIDGMTVQLVDEDPHLDLFAMVLRHYNGPQHPNAAKRIDTEVFYFGIVIQRLDVAPKSGLFTYKRVGAFKKKEPFRNTFLDGRLTERIFLV
jgi:hypothetical protein